MAWREEAISRRRDRENFDCGSIELNEHLRRYARQHHESVGAKTFVAVQPAEPTRILGYYTISPGAIEFAKLPIALTRPLGRYEVPAFAWDASLSACRSNPAGWGASFCLRPAGGHSQSPSK